MKIDIRDLLPEELSDESAYQLVNFFIDLTTELESCCFAQMRRHVKSTAKTRQDYLIHAVADDDDPPF